MVLAGRGLPKINGSSAGESIKTFLLPIYVSHKHLLTLSPGFIALVVCLSVAVVALCTAVYVLLRDHSPSDEERTVRRQICQRRREQEQSESMKSFTYDSSSTPPATLAQKIGSFVGVGPKSNENGTTRSKKGGKNGKGWVQAGSGDNWEHVLRGENEVQTRSLSAPRTQKNTGGDHSIRLADRSVAKDGGPVNPPLQPPRLPYSERDDQSASSELLYSPFTSSSPPPLRTAVTRLQTQDSFSPSSATLASSSTVRALTGSPEPYRVGSMDDDIRSPNERHFSIQSGGSVSTRTSHTGTKFIESLE
jgi:hypothetical protein